MNSLGLAAIPYGGRAVDEPAVDGASVAGPVELLSAPPQSPDPQGPGSPVPSVPDFFDPGADAGAAVPGAPVDDIFAAPDGSELSDPLTVPNISPLPTQPHSVHNGLTDHGATGDGASSGSSIAAPAPRPVGAPLRRVNPPQPGTSGFRATVESDAPAWIGPYMSRAHQQPPGMESTPVSTPSVQMPLDFRPWWDDPVRQQAGLAPSTLGVNINSLVQQALQHSPQVQMLQAEPEVQQRIVRQEEAAFDWRTFLEARYDDLNDPVGNTLTTGNGDDRFNDNQFNWNGGLKRRTESGGQLEVAQRIGHQYNNSVFLLPNPQSTSRLELSFRQPLLSRSGAVYNESQIVLARINTSMAGDETLTSLQEHLSAVAEAYWQLYRARAEFYQRQKLLASARETLAMLEGRNQLDTIPRQTLRARATVARAESRMQRAVADIRNAESQLRLLVNDPAMLNSGPIELLPEEPPASVPLPTGLREALQTALVNRPDISRAIREMRSSSVKLGVSRNEILPRLDLLISSYVAGLEERSQFEDAISNQFSEGRPGYTVGLEFELPLGNRAAKARLEQRQWELQRAIAGFRTTVETSLTEVEIANREVDTAWRDLLGRYQAMVAAQNEVSYLRDRFQVLPMAEDSSILLLQDLLDGYERLADEESYFVKAQTAYALSLIQLRRATGTLMRSRYETPVMEPEESEWVAERVAQATDDAASRSTGRIARSATELASRVVAQPDHAAGASGNPRTPAVPASHASRTPRTPVRPATASYPQPPGTEPGYRTQAPPPPALGGHTLGRYR